MPTGEAYEWLEQNHGERRVFQAPADGVVMELWVNDQSGSWTLFVTRPDGLSCLVTAGEGMTYQPIGLRL